MVVLPLAEGANAPGWYACGSHTGSGTAELPPLNPLQKTRSTFKYCCLKVLECFLTAMDYHARLQKVPVGWGSLQT